MLVPSAISQPDIKHISVKDRKKSDNDPQLRDRAKTDFVATSELCPLRGEGVGEVR